MDSARAASDRHSSSKQRWFHWHSMAGVLSGLLLFSICWSGAFATLSHELDWLFNPDIRVSADDETPYEIPAIQKAVADRYPHATILNISKSLYDNFATDVLIETRADQTRHVYVDPYTLTVTGSTSFLNIQRYFRDFHRRFFGLGGIGFYLVCLYSLPLLFSLISGILFYKRWWTRFFKFQIGRSFRAFVSNLHKFAGLWSLWFVLIIAITGAWYLFERLRSDIGDGVFAYADSISSAEVELPLLDLDDGESRLSFSELWEMARQARPELDIHSVSLDRGGYFYVQGEAGHFLVRSRANKLYIDPVKGTVVYNQYASELSPYWRWSDTADPLHFGDFGGFITKLLWFLFGILLAGLSLSGTLLHIKRLQRTGPRKAGHRFTLVFGILGAAIVAVSVPMPLAFLDQFGPVIDGVRYPAELPSGTVTFLSAWGVVTISIVAWWVYALASASRHTQASC